LILVPHNAVLAGTCSNYLRDDEKRRMDSGLRPWLRGGPDPARWQSLEDITSADRLAAAIFNGRLVDRRRLDELAAAH